MKTKLLVVICVILTAFLLASCNNGVSQAEFDELKINLENAENELNRIKGEFDDLESELEKVRAYVYVSDVSVDPIRMSLGLPTKYGYLGPGQSPDFVAAFIRKAEATGDTKLKEMVEHAFELPWGDAKQKAWNEVYVHLSDCMVGR